MVSLADLRARNVTPIWQEAVAVVQELIQTVKATTGSAELLPDLEHVALIPNGDVVALPGSPEPPIPVRHAAVMLKLLIDGVPVPPELEQFVGRNVAEPPQYDTVAEFSRNLAFFERPGRRSDVERLVGRAMAAEQTSRAEEELQRLKDRASEVTQVMAPPEFLQQQKKAKTVPIALVAAIGVVTIGADLVGVAAGAKLPGPRPHSRCRKLSSTRPCTRRGRLPSRDGCSGGCCRRCGGDAASGDSRRCGCRHGTRRSATPPAPPAPPPQATARCWTAPAKRCVRP